MLYSKKNGGFMSRARFLGVIAGLALAILILVVLRLEVSRASASIASASEVIQLVNQLRRANGLQPYQVNQALMAAAQAHSDYQAAQGSVTHNGQGGSRPHDRAVANGYGDGAAVSVSENIAGGSNLSASGAVNWWQGDNLHLTTMLSPNYQEVGAGVAESGDTVYYTLVAGYVSGSPPPPASEGTSPTSSSTQVNPEATAIAAASIKIATPRPDGAVVHVVEQGQVLWNISVAYKVSLTELMALNNLTDRSVIYPGDKLLIHLAEATPAITAIQTISATATDVPASNTPRPTRTPVQSTPTPIAAAMLTIGDQSSSQPGEGTAGQSQSESGIDPILIMIAVLVLIGAGLVFAGSVMKRKAKVIIDSQQD
jgi:LysM repeat protein